MSAFSGWIKRYRSKKIIKRVQVLEESVSLFLKYAIPEDIFELLIEDGVCSEYGRVRELSFACLYSTYLYAGSVSARWGSVRSAILTEMSAAEEPRPLASALHILTLLSDAQLLDLFASKDIISAFEDLITSPEVPLRGVAIARIAHLIDRIWSANISSTSFESSRAVSSASEAKRMHDDMRDIILSLYKSFALGILGKAPGREVGETLEDNLSLVPAYANALLCAMERYNAATDRLDVWSSALMGESCVHYPVSVSCVSEGHHTSRATGASRTSSGSIEAGWTSDNAIAHALTGGCRRGLHVLPTHTTPHAREQFLSVQAAGFAPVIQVILGTLLTEWGVLVDRWRASECQAGQYFGAEDRRQRRNASHDLRNAVQRAMDTQHSGSYGHAEGAFTSLLAAAAVALLHDFRDRKHVLRLSVDVTNSAGLARGILVDLGGLGASSVAWDPLGKSKKDEENRARLQYGASTSAVGFAERVLDTVLAPIVRPTGCAEVGDTIASITRRLRALRHIVVMLQEPCLSAARMDLAKPTVLSLLGLVDSAVALSPNQRNTVLSWALQLCRFLPRRNLASVGSDRIGVGMLPLLLSRLELVEDEARLTRLLSEFSTLVFTRAGDGGRPGQAETVRSLFRSTYVMDLLEDQRAIRYFRVRLAAVMFRTSRRVLRRSLMKAAAEAPLSSSKEGTSSGETSGANAHDMAFDQKRVVEGNTLTQQEMNKRRGELRMIAGMELLAAVEAAVTVLKELTLCLGWPDGGSSGDSAVVEYARLLGLLSSALTPLASVPTLQEIESAAHHSHLSSAARGMTLIDTGRHSVIRAELLAIVDVAFDEYLRLRIPSVVGQLAMLSVISVYLPEYDRRWSNRHPLGTHDSDSSDDDSDDEGNSVNNDDNGNEKKKASGEERELDARDTSASEFDTDLDTTRWSQTSRLSVTSVATHMTAEGRERAEDVLLLLRRNLLESGSGDGGVLSSAPAYVQRAVEEVAAGRRAGPTAVLQQHQKPFASRDYRKLSHAHGALLAGASDAGMHPRDVNVVVQLASLALLETLCAAVPEVAVSAGRLLAEYKARVGRREGPLRGAISLPWLRHRLAVAESRIAYLTADGGTEASEAFTTHDVLGGITGTSPPMRSRRSMSAADGVYARAARWMQLRASLPDVGALRLTDTAGPRVGCFGPLPALCRLAGAAEARRRQNLPVACDEDALSFGLQLCTAGAPAAGVLRRDGASWQLCAADVEAMVDDVLYAHALADDPHSLVVHGHGHGDDGDDDARDRTQRLASHSSTLLRRTLQDDDCAWVGPWQVLSGSCDVLCIRARSVPDAASRSVRVDVEVINGAGFKVPGFDVQLITRRQADTDGASTGDLWTCESGGYDAGLDGITRTLVPADGVAAATTAGVPYVLPNSSWRRSFLMCFEEEEEEGEAEGRQCVGGVKDDTHRQVGSATAKLRPTGMDVLTTTTTAAAAAAAGIGRSGCASATDIIVRITFPEVRTAPVSSTSARGGQKGQDQMAFGGGAQGEQDDDDGDVSSTAQMSVDSGALHIPSSTALLPYGLGALTSMGAWVHSRSLSQSQSQSGIHCASSTLSAMRTTMVPEGVFQSLWTRLFRHRFLTPVVSHLASEAAGASAHAVLLGRDALSPTARGALTSLTGTDDDKSWACVWAAVQESCAARCTWGPEHGRVHLTRGYSHQASLSPSSSSSSPPPPRIAPTICTGASPSTPQPVLAWAWHTWWGAEATLRIVLQDRSASKAYATGMAELRASDLGTLTQLKREIPSLLAQLTAGYVRVPSTMSE